MAVAAMQRADQGPFGVQHLAEGHFDMQTRGIEPVGNACVTQCWTRIGFQNLAVMSQIPLVVPPLKIRLFLISAEKTYTFFRVDCENRPVSDSNIVVHNEAQTVGGKKYEKHSFDWRGGFKDE